MRKNTQPSEKSKTTPLKKLFCILVQNNDNGNVWLFHNQDVFFNCIFNISEDEESGRYYSDDILTFIRKFLFAEDYELEKNDVDLLNILYASIIGYIGNEKIKKINDMSFTIRGDANSKSKTSKVVKGFQKIPSNWRDYFGLEKNDISNIQNKYRTHFVEPLSLLIQFVIKRTRNDIIKKEDLPYDSLSKDSCVNYYSLDITIWEKIVNSLKKSDLLFDLNKDTIINDVSKSFYYISYVIFRTVLLQAYPDNDFTQPKISNKNGQTLDEQKREYEELIDIYGYKTIDRFHMLKKYSKEKKNIYCASELGKIYYYGDTFSAERCIFKIEKDEEKSEECYRLCTEKSYSKSLHIIRHANWSLGLMILDGKSHFYPPHDYETAEKFFTECGDYPPALHSLGKLYKQKGTDEIEELMKSGKLSGKYATLDTHDGIVNMFEKYIEFTYEAASAGYIPSYNSLASFLGSKKGSLGLVRKSSKIKSMLKDKNITRLHCLELSAENENPWGLDQLGNYYYDLYDSNENYAEKGEYKQKAYDNYKKAYNQDYAWAALHLIVYSYFEEGSEEYESAIDLINRNQKAFPDVKEELDDYFNSTKS